NINVITGGAGNDSFTIGASGSIGTLAGGSGTNSLSSANGSTWNISGSNAGSITSVLTSFTGMNSLTNTASTDSFVFGDNINFNGTITGNVSDTLDYSAYAGSNAITASITGTKSGTVINGVTLNFSNINVITGGAGDDVFSIGASGSIGTLNGGAGNDS